MRHGEKGNGWPYSSSQAVLGNGFTQINQLKQRIAENLEQMRTEGVEPTMKKVIHVDI